MVVMLAVGRFTLWARDNSPVIRVETTPVNRDIRSGTSYAPIVKKAAPSVVNIFTTHFVKERQYRDPRFNNPLFRQFFGDPSDGDSRELTRREQSLGSGVIVSPDGYILTANHVVEDADEIKVAVADNKKEYTARVIGKDRATDVAVLKIEAKDLPAVTLADSDLLEVGDVVLAIGNPFNVGQTVTMGIVSAVGRNGLPGFNQYQDFIQTDAAINPGNSGGALVDAEGRLVGINTAIVSPSGGNNGIGLAVPINMARSVLERLLSGGKITRGYLGILPQDVDAGLAAQFNLADQNGALIGDVVPDAPAAKAGLKSGDVIISINGKAIADAHGLQLTVSECAPGSAATVKFIRNGASKTIVITLGELPGGYSPDNEEPSTPETGSVKTDALDGVTVADLEPEVRAQLHVPPKVQGALVTDVDASSNAAAAGLQPNDLIVEINRRAVTNSDDAVRLGKSAQGDQILLKIWRRNGNFAATRYLSVDNTAHAR